MRNAKHSTTAAVAIMALAALGATPLVVSPAHATESSTLDRAARSAKDAGITAQVKTKIMADADTRGININVDTDEGHVLLRGTAGSETASRKAERAAQSVDGVKLVTNGLIVADASANPQTATAKMQQAARTGADRASDAWVTTKVKSQLLADSSVKASDIGVSTHDGVVTLDGTVASSEARAQVIARAESVDGVSSVNAQHLKVVR
jgi:osmotically-inducible protein OsmY